jgi:hypothetical protein
MKEIQLNGFQELECGLYPHSNHISCLLINQI